MLTTYFKFAQNHTNLRTEIIAGVTTFLTMAYIIVVNPNILSTAGMHQGAVFVATCLAAGIGCILMGLVANYPVALAPTMGMNAYFTYVVVQGMGYSWRVGLGAVFIAGILFLILTLLRWRQWIINTIPNSIKLGIAIGIGFFLAIIALKNVGIVVMDAQMQFHWGSIYNLPAWLSFAGLAFIIILSYWRIPGAIMLGIIAVTGIGIAMGISSYQGLTDIPPSIVPTWLALDIPKPWNIGFITVVFTFFFVALFDATGTLIGTLSKANLYKHDLNEPRFAKALTVDSISTIIGALLGTSITGAYVESAAGITAGGRTGLTAVITGLLFFGALFFAPLAATIPSYATAAALLFVACLMASGIKQMAWKDISEWVPSAVTSIMTPLTFSIAHGISWGFISYVIIKLMTGKYRQCSISIWILTAVFILYLGISK